MLSSIHIYTMLVMLLVSWYYLYTTLFSETVRCMQTLSILGIKIRRSCIVGVLVHDDIASSFTINLVPKNLAPFIFCIWEVLKTWIWIININCKISSDMIIVLRALYLCRNSSTLLWLKTKFVIYRCRQHHKALYKPSSAELIKWISCCLCQHDLMLLRTIERLWDYLR